ncbi:MAG: Crp/Fnr family transcriptional regulator [Deltaproteobacteria bacterium]|nr:Crp/Fnr family transcriptional regulator [Deltaproteobacteria bacterium]MCL4874972.1 Crp/Fnr family transcriptional regulator [bacterium]
MKTTLDKESVCALCRCHIRENTLFTGLNEKQLEAFKEAVVVNNYKKRGIVFMEGDDCTGIYILRAGRVKLVRSSSTGKEHIIKILDPGDLLGFEVFYNARTYKNTAVSMEDCDLCYIDRHALFKILETEPAIARKLIIALGKELNSAYERISRLGLLNAREKLAHLLYTLATDYGVKEDGAVKLNLTLSRLEIAELLGITQETSIRLLKSFKEEGIIDIRRKEIVINSLSRLKELGE